MFNCNINWKKVGLFACGTLFGSAGFKILGSKDARKVYTGVTAAVLRGKDGVMKAATCVQENAEDIYAEAVQENEKRAAADAAVDDEETAEVEEEESKNEDVVEE
ncbi:MAG: DUF6110 family protein [Lachnospiraceae bacterium]|nr:DUF6110 family protein [Lachnospiraceae bacterium]